MLFWQTCSKVVDRERSGWSQGPMNPDITLMVRSKLYFFSCQAALPSSWSTELSPEPLPSQTFFPFYFQPLGWQVHAVPRTQWRPPQTAPTFKKRLSFAAVFRVEFCVVPPPRSVYSICLCESQAVQARSRALKIAWRMTYTSALKLLWDEFTSPFFISPQDAALAKLIALKIIIKKIK